MEFVAIDFETASYRRYSACAVGIVVVNDGIVVDRYRSLIHPPGNYIRSDFIEIHGIRPADTKNAPGFCDVYPEIRSRLSGRIAVAHNAPFDSGVLFGTMERHGIPRDDLKIRRFDCTVQIYRKLGYRPCDLASLSERFAIPLNHHDPLSDALACAELYQRAEGRRGSP